MYITFIHPIWNSIENLPHDPIVRDLIEGRLELIWFVIYVVILHENLQEMQKQKIR